MTAPPNYLSEPERIKKIASLATYYLSRREYSRKELSELLIRKYDDVELAEKELDRLEQSNLLSDERYAEAFIRYKYNRGKGPNTIRQELRLKGIQGEYSENLLNADEFDWHKSAENLYQRKYGTEKITSIKDKAKRQRFIYSRGFDIALVQHLMISESSESDYE